MFNTLVKIVRFFLYPFLRVRTVNKEYFPKEGEGCIVAFNHTSNWDPVAAALAVPRELHFMAKKELFDIKPLGWLIRKLNAFPIDRSTSDVKAIKTALTILKNNEVLLMFPEGKRLKEDDRTSDDAKNGVALLAHRSKTPVVPASIVGNYKIFSTITVVFGKPVYLNEYYGKKIDTDTMHKISSHILSEIRKLGEDEKKTLAK